MIAGFQTSRWCRCLENRERGAAQDDGASLVRPVPAGLLKIEAFPSVHAPYFLKGTLSSISMRGFDCFVGFHLRQGQLSGNHLAERLGLFELLSVGRGRRYLPAELTVGSCEHNL